MDEFKIASLMEKGYTREQAEERIILEQQAENLRRSRSYNITGSNESVASASRSITLVDEGVPRYTAQNHARNPSSLNLYSAYNQHQISLDAATVATQHSAHSTTSNTNSLINAVESEQLDFLMNQGYTREQASIMSQRDIINIMKERSGAVGHRTSGSNASWELPTAPANLAINSWSTTSTYPGYHTRARQVAGAHYFADPLPMPPHIQPQPPQPLFYTSSSSSNDFLETQRTHRHGSGSGSGSGSVFHDGNSHSSSVSSDYLHRQGMMLQSVNSSDSTVYTGYHRRVPSYVPSLSGSGSYNSLDRVRRTQLDNELDGNEVVNTDVVIPMGEPPMAYATASGHPEVYEQLDGEQENFEEEEQEEEIQVLMETGYTRDQAIEFLRRNRPPSPGRSLFVVEGIQQQPPSGQVVVQPSSAIPLQGTDFDPPIYQRSNNSVSELAGVYFGDNSWDCDSKRWCCCRSTRCLALYICWVFILIAGIIIGVLFLYPRDVVISQDSSKYNTVSNNPSKSSIVHTYRIANNNWYAVTVSNFQFTMTASPIVPGSSLISFTAAGVSSPPSKSIDSRSDFLLTVTYSFSFVTKDQLQLARSVYSCNYTYIFAGSYAVSDWQTSKTNTLQQSKNSMPCNITRTNPVPSVAPSSKSPVPLPSTVPTRTPSFRITAQPLIAPSFRITAQPLTAPPTQILTLSPSSSSPNLLSTT